MLLYVPDLPFSEHVSEVLLHVINAYVSSVSSKHKVYLFLVNKLFQCVSSWKDYERFACVLQLCDCKQL
jgi:hypothetical protein